MNVFCWRILVIWASRWRIWNAPCMHSCLNKRKVAQFTICYIFHESPLMHELTLHLISNSRAPCFVYKSRGCKSPESFKQLVLESLLILLLDWRFVLSQRRETCLEREHWHESIDTMLCLDLNLQLSISELIPNTDYSKTWIAIQNPLGVQISVLKNLINFHNIYSL